MIVEKIHWLADDPFEKRVVSRLCDRRMKRNVVVGREDRTGRSEQIGQIVKVRQSGPAGGQARRFDLHGAPYLHQLDDPLGSPAHQSRQGFGEVRVGQSSRRWFPAPRVQRSADPGP